MWPCERFIRSFKRGSFIQTEVAADNSLGPIPSVEAIILDSLSLKVLWWRWHLIAIIWIAICIAEAKVAVMLLIAI